MMDLKAPTRRACLYIPASSQKMLTKSHDLTVDCVIYDLEDSVAEDKKASARVELREFLDGPRPSKIKEIAVRINGIDTGHMLADMEEVLKAKHIDALVIPKVQSAGDVLFVQGLLRHLLPERYTMEGGQNDAKPPIKILPLIESAQGLTNLAQICAASPYLGAIIFAAEDFTLDLGITRTAKLPELLYARSAIVATARAHNVESIVDMVCTAYKGTDGQKQLEEESLSGKNLGFTGKQCIHPAQVSIVQDVFAPNAKDVEWAVKVIIANEKAKAQGRGAWSLDGQMIDAPVVSRATHIVEKAKRCDFDVEALNEKFAGQEPE